jgi:hypothetical protein
VDRDRLYDVLVSQVVHDDRICSLSLSLSSFSLYAPAGGVGEALCYPRYPLPSSVGRGVQTPGTAGVYFDRKRPVRPVANLLARPSTAVSKVVRFYIEQMISLHD